MPAARIALVISSLSWKLFINEIIWTSRKIRIIKYTVFGQAKNCHITEVT